MANLTLKNLPPRLHDRLRAEAERNRRSLNSEVIHRLERSLELTPSDPGLLLDRVRAVREGSPLPYLRELDLRRARRTGRS